VRVAETQLHATATGHGISREMRTSGSRPLGTRAFTPKLTPGESESCGAERTRCRHAARVPKKRRADLRAIQKIRTKANYRLSRAMRQSSPFF